MTTRLNRLKPIIDKIQSFDLSALNLSECRVNSAVEKYCKFRTLYYNFVVPLENGNFTFFTLCYKADYDLRLGGYVPSAWTIELFNDVRFDKYDFGVGFRMHVEEFAKAQKYESDVDVALSDWNLA